jgi:membrane protease YdiL (CAAX protease family)
MLSWSPLVTMGTRTVSLLAVTVGSSFIFALQHLRRGPGAAAYAGFYGILFSILFVVTGNLLSVTVAHAGGNLFVTFYTSRESQRRRVAHETAVALARIDGL